MKEFFAGMFEFLKAAIIWGTGLLLNYVGGFDNALETLLVIMVLDYLTGVMKGAKKGEISSSRARNGIRKKATMLIVIIVANLLDNLAGFQTGNLCFRNIIVYFYIGMEGISVVENAEAIGIPVHSKLKGILESYSKAEGGNND